MGRWLGIVAIALTALAGCDFVSWWRDEVRTKQHFEKHVEAFKALGDALIAYPEIDSADYCPPTTNCVWIGPESGPTADQLMFEGLLADLAKPGLTFFNRSDDGVVWLGAFGGGQIGDYEVEIRLLFDPEGIRSYPNCAGYHPEGYEYDCMIELEHGWKLHRGGINLVMVSQCSEIISACYEAGGDHNQCQSPTCPELLEGQGK